MQRILVRRSADPSFMHGVLTHWSRCVERYHQFHSPEPHDPDHGRFIWDSINGQHERSHVSVFSTAAWLAGGVAITEIGKRDDVSKRARCGDIYMCSPAYVAFEGEAKPFDVADEHFAEAVFLESFKNVLATARSQHSTVLKRDYDYSPIYLIFIRTVHQDPVKARLLFEACITHLTAISGIDGAPVTAFAASPTSAVAPIKWDEKKYHPGSIVCVYEDKFYRHCDH